jgi:hypothetical protein
MLTLLDDASSIFPFGDYIEPLHPNYSLLVSIAVSVT